jgi:hypothetical protein
MATFSRFSDVSDEDLEALLYNSAFKKTKEMKLASKLMNTCKELQVSNDNSIPA